jgi:molybdopterin-guanine dinucleotide biosynthesis protein A
MAAGAAVLKTGRPALVVATDLPCLTVSFLQDLADLPAPTAAHCVIPHDRDGRAQPLCARYSPEALALAQELVTAGHRAMRDLLPLLLVVALAVNHETTDVDTPADLAAIQPR